MADATRSNIGGGGGGGVSSDQPTRMEGLESESGAPGDEPAPPEVGDEPPPSAETRSDGDDGMDVVQPQLAPPPAPAAVEPELPRQTEGHAAGSDSEGSEDGSTTGVTGMDEPDHGSPPPPPPAAATRAQLDEEWRACASRLDLTLLNGQHAASMFKDRASDLYALWKAEFFERRILHARMEKILRAQIELTETGRPPLIDMLASAVVDEPSRSRFGPSHIAWHWMAVGLHNMNATRSRPSASALPGSHPC